MASAGAKAWGRGFGSVYKGIIKPKNGKGHKEWLAEVQFLGVVNHPNLVKLLGYCSVDGERGIQRLLGFEPSSWITRLQIMLGAAQGLAYLHEGLEVQVIYRDFKSSNVLLDEDFKPKLSDFGLAREGPKGDRLMYRQQW
ncbi:putative transferase, protein kinase RLK-Pelle-RLCK-VIIa-2 family [Rosa chinensis]|uniref:Putative transferase, protein kinase RLK-Pelle-RLCK-VIIa-2 family n=1 Tax=Rosa chinensis TaxID=74649 RepID=A0A2P6SQJ4_ROSCH|nr:putative transferase, protein kinase RLK-Pelle-RLCK-VIIa-2 family [Rosa chinensis]